MKRSVWKWLLGIAIGTLIALILFTISSWALLNATGAMLLAMMGNTGLNAIPFSDFMVNFVGSPLFYVYVADVSVLLISAVVLIATRQKSKP